MVINEGKKDFENKLLIISAMLFSTSEKIPLKMPIK